MWYYLLLTVIVVSAIYLVYRWFFTVRKTRRLRFEEMEIFFDEFINTWPPDGMFIVLTSDFDRKHCFFQTKYDKNNLEKSYTFTVDEKPNDEEYFNKFKNLLKEHAVEYEIIENSNMYYARELCVPRFFSKKEAKKIFKLIPEGFGVSEDHILIGKAWAVREIVKRA